MPRHRCRVLIAIAALTLVAQGAEQEKGTTMSAEGKVVLSEDFSNGMSNWWVEGGEKV